MLTAGFGPLDGSTDGIAALGVSGVILAGTFSPANAAPPVKNASTRPSPTELLPIG